MEFFDDRQKTWCIHCSRNLFEVEADSDHVPSKSLLRKPYPPNLPTIQVCEVCNREFSLDEEYLFLFLKCVLAGTTDPEEHDDPKAQRALARSGGLRARIESSRVANESLGDRAAPSWTPEVDRIGRVILKNARGHVFYEYGEPMMMNPAQVAFMPLAAMDDNTRATFEGVRFEGPLPEVGSRMLTRMFTGQDLMGGWVNVQDGVYRYSVAQSEITLVRSVLYEYLATEVYWKLG